MLDAPRRSPAGPELPATPHHGRLPLALAISLSVMAIAALGIVIGVRSGPGTSPFRHPVVHDASAAGDRSFAPAIVAQYQHAYGAVGVSDGIPIVRVGTNQAKVPVAVTSGCNDFRPGTGRVPIPSSAAGLISTSPDSPLVIYQASTDTEWELWQIHALPGGGWTACWGGRLEHESSSNGVFPAPYGLSASGISYLATTITEADIARGRIDHTIGVDLTSCTGQVAPANRHDCASTGEPAEGSILRLPTDERMPAGLTPFGRLVFRALQHYGMVVMDRAGAVMVQAETPKDWALQGHIGTDPITTSWAGRAEYQQVAALPWKDLEAVAPSGRA